MTTHSLLSDRFVRAFEFASIVHATQVRKETKIPYVAHLMGVTSLALEHGADEDVAIAALLHDAPEDQGGYAMLTQIKARFGERVAKIIEGCTDTFETPKPSYVPRKQAYIEHLKSADVAVCLVAAADKLHNARAILSDLRTVGPDLWKRFSAGPEVLHWYYHGVTTALVPRLTGCPGFALVEELQRVIATIWTKDGRPFGSYR